jgi:hypothetical protein
MKVGDRLYVSQAVQPVQYLAPEEAGLKLVAGERWIADPNAQLHMDISATKFGIFEKTRDITPEDMTAAIEKNDAAARRYEAGAREGFMVGIPENAPQGTEDLIKSAITGTRVTVIRVESQVELAGNMNDRQNGIFIDESMIGLVNTPEFNAALGDAVFFQENRNMLINLNSITISSKTRAELERIMDVIKDNLEKMQAVDIDAAVRTALQRENAGHVDSLKKLSADRKTEIAPVYGGANVSPLFKALAASTEDDERIAIATTETIAMNDMFTVDNMKKAREEGKNITNVFVYGEKFASEYQARAFLAACGYDEAGLKDVIFINKTGLSYADLVNAIAVKAETTAANVGLRSAENELQGALPTMGQGTILEVQPVTIRGEKYFVSIDTYQILLKILTNRTKSSSETLDAVGIPGLSYDRNTNAFKYLPKAVPIDYDKEVRTFMNAMESIATAA